MSEERKFLTMEKAASLVRRDVYTIRGAVEKFLHPGAETQSRIDITAENELLPVFIDQTAHQKFILGAVLSAFRLHASVEIDRNSDERLHRLTTFPQERGRMSGEGSSLAPIGAQRNHASDEFYVTEGWSQYEGDLQRLGAWIIHLPDSV
jgi:hypothetical protein